MPTPLITGDAASQQFLRERFHKLHAYSLFAWRGQMTKKEAHAEAWRRWLADRDRQMQIQAMIQRQRNSTI